MIPVLFDKAATTFNTYGKGALKDAISCIVTEERNGIFELEMQFPISGNHFGDLKEDNIILAKPSVTQQPQAFRIYKVSEPLDGIITVSAEHISYELRFIPVMPFTAHSCSEALSLISEKSATTNPFTFHTDKTTQSIYSFANPRSARSVLGGASGSILEQFKGEYKWDNYDVYLLNARGEDRGVTLRYGKNITQFNQITDMSDTVTGILPYWKSGTNLVTGDITEIQTTGAYKRIETVDVTSMFDGNTTPTKAQVTAKGAEVLNNKSFVGVPSVNFNISFIDLAQTEEYKEIAPLETVGLCDTVTIIFERYNLSTQAKVIKTVYDSILERYNSIEIGDTTYSLTETVAQQQEAVKDANARILVLDEQIVLKVSKGHVSSEISVESGRVTFNSNRLIVNSTNFKLDEDGNAEFGGDITSSATISGSDIIGATITGGTITGATIQSTGSVGGQNYSTTISQGQIDTNHITLPNQNSISGYSAVLPNVYADQVNQIDDSQYNLFRGLTVFSNGISVDGYVLSVKTETIGDKTITYLGV